METRPRPFRRGWERRADVAKGYIQGTREGRKIADELEAHRLRLRRAMGKITRRSGDAKRAKRELEAEVAALENTIEGLRESLWVQLHHQVESMRHARATTMSESRDARLEILNSRAFREIAGAILRDGRNIFNPEFKGIYPTQKTTPKALSVGLIDLDYFKLYNDRYGHPFGDRLLEQIAVILEHNVQKFGGIAARYGGEEFAVLLFGGADVAKAFAESVRSDIAEYVEHRPITIKQTGKERTRRKLTVSMGFWCSDTVTEKDEVDRGRRSIYGWAMETADNLLYRVKGSGRDGYRILNRRAQNSL